MTETETETNSAAAQPEPATESATEVATEAATEASTEVPAKAATEVATEAPTGLEKKIIKQIEYYFGDINLAKDKFMQEQVKLDDGWIPMETMLKFNRLSSLSDKAEDIVAAIKKSTAGLIEISDDSSKIRRSTEKPLPENTKDRAQDLRLRNIYAKGFPTDATLDQLQEWFEKEFGTMEHIQMRRMKDRAFKGSVFAIFESKEDAKKFLDAETVKYEENTLEKRLLKDDYFKTKLEEKKQQKEDEAVQKEKDKVSKEEEEEQNLKDKITPGAVLHIQGLKQGTRIEDLKEIFGEVGTVAWVDYAQNEPEAKIRFHDKDGAKTAIDKMKEKSDGKMIVKEAEVESRILEGEEEEKYWKKAFEDQKERRNRKRFGGRGRGGRGGGGRGGKRGYQGRDYHGSSKRPRN